MKHLLRLLFFVALSSSALSGDDGDLIKLQGFLADFEVVAICRVIKQPKGEKYSLEKLLTGDWEVADTSCKQSAVGGFDGKVLVVCNPKKEAKPAAESAIMAIFDGKVWWVPTTKPGGNIPVGIPLQAVVEIYQRKQKAKATK